MKNEERSMEARIRQHQNILIYSGMGVILFGVWSMAKMALFQLMDEKGIEGLIEIADQDMLEYRFVVELIVIVLMLMDLLLRVYVGMNAIRIGKQGKCSKRFLVITILYILVSAFTVVSLALNMNIQEDYFLDNVANFLIDLTSFVALTEIICSTWKLRRLSRIQAMENVKSEINQALIRN